MPEAFDSYLPAAGVEYDYYDYYDQLGSDDSDQPDYPDLWQLDRWSGDAEELPAWTHRTGVRVGGWPEKAIAVANRCADLCRMGVIQRLVCTFRGHAWGPLEGDVNGALRTCARCGRNQPIDLQPKPYKGVIPDGGVGGGQAT